MAFIVTARKWRPQLFEEVVGQQHITTTLKNAIENDRIGHAYIFAGPRGVGKTTTARILAKRLNCLNPNGGEPCNECEACQNFLKSQSLDIIEIDGASNRRIDEIRTLRESVKYAPTSGKYKVYIIDEVHMLTTESFNALLKTLEEPPEHTIFIFATTDIHKVPLTIISRCQRFDFRRIEHDEIKKLLAKIAKEENIEIDDESLTIIAKKADGALRDAESIFDQVVSFCGNKVDVKILRQMLNLIDDEIYFNISDAILEKDFKVAFNVSEKIYQNGWNFIDFANGLLEHFRNILTVLVAGNAELIETSEFYQKKYIAYTNKFSKGDLLRILSFVSKLQTELRMAQDQKLKVEISLSHLIGLEKSATITELLNNTITTATTEAKKKSNFVETSNKTTEQQKDKTPVKQNTFKIDIQTDKSVPPKSAETKKEIIPTKQTITKTDVVQKQTGISLEKVKENWKFYKDFVAKEKFTLGDLIKNTTPTKIEGNKISVEVEEKDDVEILNKNKELLNKFFFTTYNANYNLNFIESTSAKPNNKQTASTSKNEADTDKYNNHPIVKAIIEQLGGREFK